MKTMQQAQQMLKAYKQVFTYAYLLPGEKLEQGLLHAGPGQAPTKECLYCRCAGTAKRCSCCIGHEALKNRDKRTRVEYVDPDVYQITAEYMEIEGKPTVLELVQRVELSSMVGQAGSLHLMEMLQSYRSRMYQDSVTGVFNRNYYDDELRDRVMQAAVAMIDLDNLKFTNDTIRHAYEMGVSDYVTRPFDERIVRRRVNNTIMLYARQRRLVDMIGRQIHEKERNNRMMGYILSHIVEYRNGESGPHLLNVRTLTEELLNTLLLLTDQYQLTVQDRELIVEASTLHDIGKIAVDDKILNKPGKLTAEEFAVMKTHTTIGDEMLATMTEYQDEPLVHFARQICRWHHERWDGKGYPDGLKGNDIPIGAQVVALADVYDALTSSRVYKPPYTHGQAVKMIMNGECGQFNPLMLECLRRIAPQLPNILHSDTQTRPGCPVGAKAAEKAPLEQ